MLSFVLFICLKLLGLLPLCSWTPNKPTTTKTNPPASNRAPTLPCSHSTVDHHFPTVNTARFNRLSHSFTACRLPGKQPPNCKEGGGTTLQFAADMIVSLTLPPQPRSELKMERVARCRSPDLCGLASIASGAASSTLNPQLHYSCGSRTQRKPV